MNIAFDFRRLLLCCIVTLLLSRAASAQPTPASTDEMAKNAQTVAKSVMMVGAPKFGHGTAFVISKEHRLLLTNAHVADIFHSAGSMTAIVNGTTQTFVVKKAYYHPGLMRYKKEGAAFKYFASMNPADGLVHTRSPDLAILELEPSSTELPEAISLASGADLSSLQAKPIGVFGFPSHDTSWPGGSQTIQGTFMSGAVSRMTEFNGKPSADMTKNRFVQYTLDTLQGFSGSPVFLGNGRVVAVVNSYRIAKNDDLDKRISQGIRIDCLEELLKHHGLSAKVPINTGGGFTNVSPSTSPSTTTAGYAHPYDAFMQRPHVAELQRLTGISVVPFGNEVTASTGMQVSIRANEGIDDLVAKIVAAGDLQALKCGWDAFGTQNEHFYARHWDASDLTAAHLSRRSELRVIELPGARITDRGMRFLGKLTQLNELDLSRNPAITDEGAKHLSELTGLSRLSLRETKITSAGVAHWERLTRLSKVDLGKTQVDNEALKVICNNVVAGPVVGEPTLDGSNRTARRILPATRDVLIFDGTKITDDGLPYLKPAEQYLQMLDFSETKVTGEGFKGMRFPQVTVLKLSKCPISDAGLAEIARAFPNLVELRLSGPITITPAGLEVLKNCKTLTRLDLASKSVTDEHLKVVGGWSQLRELYLHDGGFTDSGLQYIGDLVDLQTLYLSRTKITDAGLEHLNLLVALQLLAMDECPKITGSGLASLKGLTNLKMLSLRESGFASDGVKPLIQLKSVQALALNKCPGVTDDTVKEIVSMPNLQHLELMNADITDKSLPGIWASTVQNLFLDGCNRITDAGLKGHRAMIGLSLSRTAITDNGVRLLQPVLCLWLNDCKGVTDESLPILGHRNFVSIRGTSTTRAGREKLYSGEKISAQIAP